MSDHGLQHLIYLLARQVTASSSSSAEPAAPDPATVVPRGWADFKVLGRGVGLRDSINQ